jgi:hypothetical protein
MVDVEMAIAIRLREYYTKHPALPHKAQHSLTALRRRYQSEPRLLLSTFRRGNHLTVTTILLHVTHTENRTYLVSQPIVAWYYTQLIGDARQPPTLLAAANFNGIAVIGTYSHFSKRSHQLRLHQRRRSIHCQRWWRSMVHQPE